MKFKKVSIIGLGLIGSSLAGSLKKTGIVEKIFGIDKDTDTLNYALDKGIVDEASNTIDNRIQDSDIVVLATYVDSIPSIANKLVVSENTLVTDVGSVKEQIVRDITLNCKFSYIGSHPITGSEKSGIMNYDSRLFIDKICVITPTDKNKPTDISIIKKFWTITGSRVIEMEPKIHDRIFAYVSHLPHAVAFSLINSFRNNKQYLQYAGGGLNDFTRIAESSPEMWTEIFLLNKTHLLEVMGYYKDSLEEIIGLVNENNSQGLKKYLTDAVDIKTFNKK
jgi:prephenate dehydrogenase